MENRKIEEVIIQAIKKISGHMVEDKDKNLFGIEYAIAPRDMVYIVDEVESNLGVSIAEIFETDDIGIMTVRNLEIAILKKLDDFNENLMMQHI